MIDFNKRHTLALLIILFVFSIGYTQDLQIDLTLTSVGDDRFSVCGGERPVVVKLTNISGETLTDGSFTLDLSNVLGIEYTGTVSSISGTAPVYNPGNSTTTQESFDLPDLTNNEVIEFVIGLEADCGAIALAGSGGTPNFDINLTYTGGLGAQSANSGNFEVVKPALTIVDITGNPVPPPLVKTGTSASFFDANLGQTDILTTRIVNGGNGSLDEYIYYVIDHPLLNLDKVSIGTYDLPLIGTSNDTTFFAVDATAIALAVPDATSPVDDNTLFQFNEIMTFEETWTVTGCANTFPDLERGVAFGCGAAASDLCEGDSQTSGLRFGFVRPQLRSSGAWGEITEAERTEALPACYNDEILRQRFWIVNEGGAPAKNVKFSLSVYNPNQNPKVLLANNTMVSIGKFGTPINLTPVQTYTANQNYGSCSLSNQLVSADYELGGIDLLVPPGDTLWIVFESDYTECGCDNGTSTCQMRQYYYNVLNWGNAGFAAPATYEDLCELNTYDLNQVSSTDYNSALSSIFEAPASIVDEQEQTASFTISNGSNSWLRDYLNSSRTRYVNGIYRMRFTIGEGLDWKGSDADLNTPELTWLLQNGSTWPPSRVDYVDNEGGDDELYVEYSFADYPAGLSYNAGFGQGMKISFNMIGDCDETGPVCSQGRISEISSEFYFSPDSNCTDCGEGDFVDCMQNTSLDVKCPSCVPCDGVIPVSLELVRKNYECSDNDADGNIDAVNNIDFNKVARQRLISGDTLRVIYTAEISASATKPNFAGAFSVLELPAGENLSFLPQGASLRIKKSNGTIYQANILQQIPDGNLIVTNLSFDNLAALGNPIPANELYEDNDSIFVEVLLLIEDPDFLTQTEANNFRDVTITDRTFATDDTSWNVEPADRYACDNIRQRFYYVEQVYRTDWHHADTEGGCEKIRTGEYNRWTIGGTGLDYFPFEFRKPKGYIEKTVLYKAPGLEFDRILWRIASKNNSQTVRPVGLVPLQGGAVYGTLENPLAPGTLRANGEIPLSSPYVSISGDTITIFAGAFIRESFGEIESDEGFISSFSLQMKASCASEPVAADVDGEGKIIPRNTWTLDSKVFGYSSLNGGRIARPLSQPEDYSERLIYRYLGGPDIELQVPVQTNLLTGEVACFQAEILNFTDYIANYAFFSVENQSGAVIVESVTDISDANNPIDITSSVGGIYELGNMPAAGNSPSSILLEVCVRSNNCSQDSLKFVAGWDCEKYPVSSSESSCAKETTVYLVPTEAELGMVIRSPAAPIVQDLCDNQEYIIEISSAKSGHLSELELFFNLPSGQELIPGSFEIAYPLTSSDPNLATFDNPGIDPTEIYNNGYKIDISSLNPELATTGLPGTLQPGRNLLFVKFNTMTTCNYLSGGRARFLSRAKNSCGAPTNRRYSPASTLRISSSSVFYSTQLSISGGEINPCSNDELNINTEFRLRSDSGQTTSADSVMVVLPPGLTYVPNSFINLENAVVIEPVTSTESDVQTLFWPVQVGLTGGQNVQFTFDVQADDIGQACFPYQLTAATFSSREASCINPVSVCSVREVSSEADASISFVQPDLFVTNFAGDLTFSPPSEEILDYTLTILNTGASVPNGQTTTVQIVADLDNDGEFSAGDQVLNSVSTTASIPKNTSFTFTGLTSVAAGLTCNLIAVINPEATCVCNINPSYQLKPSLKLVFDKSVEVCSDEPLTVGPAAVAFYDYNWTSIDGSNVSSLNPTNDSPAIFTQKNISGANQTVQYALRIERNNSCLAYDTLTVSIFPEERRSSNIEVCRAAPFSLAGPAGGSNFLWTPSTNLDNVNAANPNVSGLSAPITYEATYTDQNGCDGFLSIAVSLQNCANTGLGDTVWWDQNYDGIFDIGEPGVSGVTVWLVNPADPTVPLRTTVTDANGAYFFSPLPSADYQIRFIQNDEMTFTLSDTGGNDTTDSDADRITGYSQSLFVYNGLLDSTFDAGIIYIDYGDLPDFANDLSYLNYLTALGSDIPSHLIIPDLAIGNIVDGEQTGQPNATARGDDTDDGTDDEDGLGIGDNEAWIVGSTVNIPLTITNNTGATAYLKGWIDWNGDGDFLDVGELVTDLNGTTFPANISLTVPGNVPADKLIGVRFRLSLDAAMTEKGFVRSGEIEDYLVRLDCPIIASPVSGGNQFICTNDTLTVLSVTAATGFVTDWYTNNTGGTPILTDSDTYLPADYGTYYAGARDPLNGCVSDTRTAISVSPLTPPVINSMTTDGEVTCTNNPTISTVVTPTGGSYSWSGPDIIGATNASSITVDAPGGYILEYTATNGCSIMDTVAITSDLTEPGAAAGLDKEVNCGELTVVLDGSSPTANATFAWTTSNGTIDSGANTATPTVSQPGLYILETTHPYTDCTTTDEVTVTRPPDLAANSSVLPRLRCDNPDGSITVNITAGTAPYIFLWSDNATSQNRTGLSAGTYTVTITDAKSCTVVLSETVNDEFPVLTISPTATCEATGSNYNLEVQIDYLFSQGSNLTVTLGTGEVRNLVLPTGDGTITAEYLGLSNVGEDNILVSVAYASDSGCDESTTYDAPEICCQVYAPQILTECNDNLTPNNPSDDFRTYSINPQGVGNGASVNITGDDTQTNVLFNQFSEYFGPFASASGDLIIRLTDSTNPGCFRENIIIPTSETCSDRIVDYGDLPASYGTFEENDGPRHVIIDGLRLGVEVDDEPDGEPNSGASADIFDDGLGINDNISFVIGNTVRIPLQVTNTTGQPSYADMWIDWNGNGTLEPEEQVADLTDENGPYPEFITVVVPQNAAQNTDLGVRIRTSLDDNMMPTGLHYSGEVEDYIIQLNCPEICPSVQLIKRSGTP